MTPASDKSESDSRSAKTAAPGRGRPAAWQRWGQRVLLVAIGLYLVTLCADFGYSRWVQSQLRAWEAEHIWTADGIREDCLPRTLGQGEEAVLFIHGINDSPRLWDDWLEAFAAQGYTCRAMRLPGFAKRNQAYAQATVEDWLTAVDEEVAALRAEHQRVHVVAHSLGAAVAIRWSILKPGRADSLALLAPAIEVSNARSPVFSVETWHHISQGLLVFTNTTYNPFVPDLRDPNASPYPYRTPFTPKSIVDETFRLLAENRGRAGELTTPLFVAQSPSDQIVDPDASRRFWKQAASTPKHWYEAEHSGHLLPLDLDAPELRQALIAFWREVAATLQDQQEALDVATDAADAR